MKFFIKAVLFVSLFIFPMVAQAAHPLITDDTETQGKGRFQIEVNGQYESEKETVAGVSVKGSGTEIEALVSYGVAEHMDVVVGVPYKTIKVTEDGATLLDESGNGDVSLELKWKFYEKNGCSLGFKPGVSLPAGDEDKGLGAGKTGYSAFFIASREAGDWAFHVNAGYVRHDNKIDERKDIMHVSVAAVKEVSEKVKAVANIGMESNSDPASGTKPTFGLIGAIYSVSKDLDVDFGVKFGLNEPEVDYAVLAGMAYRF